MPDHSMEKKSGTGSSIIRLPVETPDAFSAFFDRQRIASLLVVVELKGRQFTSTATAATAALPAQCWDYLVIRCRSAAGA